MKKISFLLLLFIAATCAAQQKPNVIVICADDLGYGDLSVYGARQISTPNIDKLAQQGLRFTDAHATSATCTPSRYALLTGQYPWRDESIRILPGDAPLIIPTGKTTLPSLFRQAGYKTAIVGKWHLGLGKETAKNWNKPIENGPNDVGFDYSFIFPATADRVPTVFLENRDVLALDSLDPIEVDYKKPIGNDPTGKDHPELLKMQSSPGQGHNQTIVNGIGRIGYMSGGKKARWTDEEVSLTFLSKAKEVINANKKNPFFLYFATTEPHVPRMPATMFKGKSKLGYRGDVILQLDWTVGEIMKELEAAGIAKNTIVIFTSDNGPVLDDGYQDEAVTKQNGHMPAGPLRGGKYSAFEGGTRLPFIVSWPSTIKAGVSDALMCQVDLVASFARLLNIQLPAGNATDSEDHLQALLGKKPTGRNVLIEQGGSISIVKEGWKYITPSGGTAYDSLTGTETGNDKSPQLYNLKEDIGEKNNLAGKYPEKVKELEALLSSIKNK
ncbi:arylsulfatase [Danxiaibacter flavus]|uniref:Arylsulfatase n=1 Tax=Danxiaibacter flavus TaxID=3049108 RepID=A0ABV3ZJ29_9BACT|nr:arylsulfatase [Chitinophagaceae bacterium DXS]